MKGEGSVESPRPRGGGEGVGEGAVVRMKLLGANPTPRASGLEPLPGIVNYFIGNDPEKWHANIPTYGKVQYDGVYPGIDLVYYGTNQRQLEYDFVVAPGADPKQIALTFDGADKIEIDRNGDLTLTLPSPIKGEGAVAAPRPASGERVGVRGDATHGEGAVATDPSVLRLKKPIVYQIIDGQRRDLDGGYVIRTDGDSPLLRGRKGDSPPSSLTPDTRHPTPDTQVGFAVAAYDESRPLIIDPVLTYSTYLGGTSSDVGNAIAVDSAGNAYVTGSTTSSTFPTTTGAYDVTCGNSSSSCNVRGFFFVPDIFVTKFSADGSQRLYSTYIGGSGHNQGNGIAVDSLGNAYVTGVTDSTDFPTTSGAFRQSPAGNLDAFVAKLNPSGSALIYSTYLGGSGTDAARGIAVSPSAPFQAYVTGRTNSLDFPTTSGVWDITCGTDGLCNPSFGIGVNDAFVTRLSENGATLSFSTFLGGSSLDEAHGIALDAALNVYVTGTTSSSNFPTAGSPLFSSSRGSSDVFVTKLNTNGTALLYSSFVGGSGQDEGYGIALDTSGNIYLTGTTASTNFPIKNAYQPDYGGGTRDAFVTKLTAPAYSIEYSTFLGGDGDESTVFSPSNFDYGFSGIAVDTSQRAYVIGYTNSSNFPTFNPIPSTSCTETGQNAFVVALRGAGFAPRYASCLGGSGSEILVGSGGIAVDGSGNAYVTGDTFSTDFPTASPLQPSNAGSADVFVAKIAATCGTATSADLVVTQADTPDPVAFGISEDLTYTLTVLNNGPSPATNVLLTDRLPIGENFVSVNSSQGSCQEVNGVVTCSLGTLGVGATATVTLALIEPTAPTLTNTVLVSGSECDPSPADNSVQETTAVTSGPAEVFLLTVGKTGGQGTIHSLNVPGIDCGNDCKQIYANGTKVSLIVSAIHPWLLQSWGGDADCADGTLTMTGNRSCTANFDPGGVGSDFCGDVGECVPVGESRVVNVYSQRARPLEDSLLNVAISFCPPANLISCPPFNVEGPAVIGVSPHQLFGGVLVRFAPTVSGSDPPNKSQIVMDWQDSGGASLYREPITPGFTGTGLVDSRPLLNVNVSGSGRVVQTSPTPTNLLNNQKVRDVGIDCPAGTCARHYDSGTQVTLMAEGFSTGFRWGGACSGTVNPCNLTMDASKTVTVTPAPTISSFTPTNGLVGASVTVNGANLTGATAVKFNGVTATFSNVTAISLTATVPAGATTGKISVTTPGGTADSVTNFTVQTPITVPNVVNQTQAAAQTSLANAGLSVGTVTQQTSATIPAGSVISQNPNAGASAPPGSAVALIISTGPPSPFTDDHALAGKVVTAAHFTEVRNAIAAKCQSTGKAAPTWSEPLVPQQTVIKKLHLDELRTEAARCATFPPKPPITAGETVIQAADLQEVRDAVR